MTSADESTWRGRLAPQLLVPVQEFVNTHAYSGRRDALGTAPEAAGVTGLPADALDSESLTRLREFREALRGVLLAHAGYRDTTAAAAVLRRQLADTTLAATADDDGSVQVSELGLGVPAFIGGLVARIVTAVPDGTWNRLKACGNDECRVAFYDRTRSRTGRFCSSELCANRARQRKFRARHDLGTSGVSPRIQF
jgi:predicted RNA-binding Zn ribbon-like protein